MFLEHFYKHSHFFFLMKIMDKALVRAMNEHFLVFCFAEEQQSCQRADTESQVNIIIIPILQTVKQKYLHVVILKPPAHLCF